MHIHVQNHAGSGNLSITPEQWDAASARAPDVSAGHRTTFGDTPEAFAQAIGTAEALVTQKAAVKALLPVPAPRLRLIFCMSAGLDGLEPYDWLPDGVALLNNRGAHAAKAGEYGIMALLMLASGMPGFAAAQREGRWAPFHGSVLAGRTVVVVGLGSLGGAVAGQAARVRTRPAPAWWRCPARTRCCPAPKSFFCPPR